MRIGELPDADVMAGAHQPHLVRARGQRRQCQPTIDLARHFLRGCASGPAAAQHQLPVAEQFSSTAQRHAQAEGPLVLRQDQAPAQLIGAGPGGEHGAVQGRPFGRGLAHLPAFHAGAGHRGVAGHVQPGQAEQQQSDTPGEGA
jgi:hypothetical protein